MQNYRYCFISRASCRTLDLHKRQVHGTVVDTTPEFYQAFLVVSIYTLDVIIGPTIVISCSNSEHSVHMQFVT